MKVRPQTLLRPRPMCAAVIAALICPAASAQLLFAAPWTKWADMTPYATNYLEVGAGYNSSDSYKFGEWSGIHKKGGFATGNLNYGWRDAADDARQFELSAFDLGWDSRSAGVAYRNQGRFGLGLNYQGLPHYATDSSSFIFTGLGSSQLGLPTGFAGISQPSGAPQPFSNQAVIAGALSPYPLKVNRNVFGLDGNVFVMGPWELLADYSNSRRDGNVIGAAVMGTNGGNPRSALVPVPVDDTTQSFTFTARYSGEQLQFQASYYYQKFDNKIDSVSWFNPYAGYTSYPAVVGFGPGSSFATGQGVGRMGTEPSNTFNQFRANATYRFSPEWRATGTIAYGVAQQDETFLPYTINSLLTAFAGYGPGLTLPRTSLDGKVEQTLINLALMGRPVRGLDVKARYQYLDNDNKTPQSRYLYIAGDAQNQPDPVGSANAVRNLPLGTTSNRFTLDASYELMRSLVLEGAYGWKRLEYKPAGDDPREEATTNSFQIALRRVANEFLTGAVSYEFTQRRGSEYRTVNPYFASTWGATPGVSGFDNAPPMRQYIFSDLDNNRLNLQGNLNPTDKLSLQVQASYHQGKGKGPDCGSPNDTFVAGTTTYIFPAHCLGRTDTKGTSLTVDGQFTPVDGATLFAFYTYGRDRYDQNGRGWQGFALIQATDSSRDYSVRNTYTDNTFGAGARFKPGGSFTEFGLRYLYNRGSGVTDFYDLGSVNATATGVPDTKSTRNSVQLYGGYRLTPQLALRANYWFEKLNSNDWAWDGVSAWSAQNVVLTGQTAPNYRNNLVMVFLQYSGF